MEDHLWDENCFLQSTREQLVSDDSIAPWTPMGSPKLSFTDLFPPITDEDIVFPVQSLEPASATYHNAKTDVVGPCEPKNNLFPKVTKPVRKNKTFKDQSFYKQASSKGNKTVKVTPFITARIVSKKEIRGITMTNKPSTIKYIIQ